MYRNHETNRICACYLTLSLLACARTFNSTSNSSADTTHTLTFGGLQRTYVLHIRHRTMPINLRLWSLISWRIGKRIHSNAYEQLRAAADEKDFIVVIPMAPGCLEISF